MTRGYMYDGEIFVVEYHDSQELAEAEAVLVMQRKPPAKDRTVMEVSP